MRILLALALAGSICGAQNRPDPDAYQQFFRQVVDLKSMGEHPAVRSMNGETITLAVPRLQDVIGLTDGEVELLHATAADCGAGIASLIKSSSALVFESRLQTADSGKVSDDLAQKLKDLDERRERIVLHHILELKSALPAASFEKLDAYVSAPADGKKSLTPSAPALVKKL